MQGTALCSMPQKYSSRTGRCLLMLAMADPSITRTPMPVKLLLLHREHSLQTGTLCLEPCPPALQIDCMRLPDQTPTSSQGPRVQSQPGRRDSRPKGQSNKGIPAWMQWRFTDSARLGVCRLQEHLSATGGTSPPLWSYQVLAELPLCGYSTWEAYSAPCHTSGQPPHHRAAHERDFYPCHYWQVSKVSVACTQCTSVWQASSGHKATPAACDMPSRANTNVQGAEQSFM